MVWIVAAGTSQMDYGWALLKMLAALVVVCALAWAAIRYGLGKLSPAGGANRRLKIHDRFALSGNRSVCIIEVAERFFLVGCAESGVNLIAELDGTKLGPIEQVRSPWRFGDFLNRDNRGERERKI